MKIQNITKQNAFEMMGSEASESDAIALIDILKATDIEDTDDISDEAWRGFIDQAITKAAPLVCGMQIQIDRSGQGHNWQDIDADEIPASIREEIEGEIVAGNDDVENFVGSNGQHYRW